MSFEECFANLKKLLGDCDVLLLSDQFKCLSTDLERVKFLLSIDEYVKCVSFDGILRTSDKNARKSIELRNSGNKFFKNGNLTEALSIYTRSICHAPFQTDEKCLSLALGNRSAVLFRLGKYNEAIEDIGLAMENDYPLSLLAKLLDRKGDCLRNMSCLIQAKDCYKQALKMCSQDHLKLAGKINAKLLSLNNSEKSNVETKSTISVATPTFQEGTNPKYPSLSSSCKVSYNISKGRHIIAARDIKPGEIILIEKPFASIVMPQRHLMHCHYCFACVVNPLPCTSCVHSVFCSDKCRHNAKQSFHKYECPIMDILDASGVDKFAQLAARAVMSIPASEICHYATSVQHANKDISAKHDGKIYMWDDYNVICSLLTNDVKRPVTDLFKRSFVAIFLLKIIEMSSYFQNSDVYVNVNVAALLLSHLQSFPCNAHEISEFVLSGSGVTNSKTRELGAGIYATLSLFNHSCNPDVTRNFYGNVCVVRAISKIKKGSEITDNYGTIFQLYPRVERHKYLNPQYYFECQCPSCLGNWPTFGESFNMSILWKCTECSGELKACMTGTTVTCGCGKDQNISRKKLHVEESQKAFEVAYSLLLSSKPKEAIPGIIAYIETLEEETCEPNNELSRCQESLKQCYGMMANCCASEL